MIKVSFKEGLSGFTLICVMACMFSSCSSYKKTAYFQDISRSRDTKEVVGNYSPMKVETDDILGINVTSLNPEASSVFNSNTGGTGGSNGTNPVAGYLVDSKGEIQLPLIGNMKVSGKSTTEVRDQIRSSLTKYLKEPVVNVRIMNFKVSVLGDVNKPGSFAVQNERLTIPEAISLAGDLNITAVRKNILLIRERNGEREYIPVDLSSKKLFSSPYYYMRNNDILYVQPGSNKYASVDNTYRYIGFLLSALSIVAILVTR